MTYRLVGCVDRVGVSPKDEISQALAGRKVDLMNAKYLNPRLRNRVIAEAEVQHAEG